MANRLVFNNIKTEKYKSISKYNVENNTHYFLFDPKNITDFKCLEGRLNGNLVYLFEYLQCMWGNDEINEYIILNNALKQELDISQFGEIKSITINNIEIKYTIKKGLFSRYFYNVIFEINDVIYYLFIKTINATKFNGILSDFLSNPLNH